MEYGGVLLVATGAVLAVLGVSFLIDFWWLFQVPSERYDDFVDLWRSNNSSTKSLSSAKLGDVPREKESKAMSAGAAIDIDTGRVMPKRSYSDSQIRSVLRG